MPHPSIPIPRMCLPTSLGAKEQSSTGPNPKSNRRKLGTSSRLSGTKSYGCLGTPRHCPLLHSLPRGHRGLPRGGVDDCRCVSGRPMGRWNKSACADVTSGRKLLAPSLSVFGLLHAGGSCFAAEHEPHRSRPPGRPGVCTAPPQRRLFGLASARRVACAVSHQQLVVSHRRHAGGPGVGAGVEWVSLCQVVGGQERGSAGWMFHPAKVAQLMGSGVILRWPR